ncbi:hypothetical protein QJS66_10665 [Kocuria rhizophila]|nr:hypothetical protein QJS66_10665 [Kocuria rhizophila]
MDLTEFNALTTPPRPRPCARRWTRPAGSTRSCSTARTTRRPRPSTPPALARPAHGRGATGAAPLPDDRDAAPGRLHPGQPRAVSRPHSGTRTPS